MSSKNKKIKKKKNKKNDSMPKYNQVPEDTLANQANELYDAGNYKKARDIYKHLVSINNDKYMKKLVDCYKRLTNNAIEASKYSNARKFLNQIDNISEKKFYLIEHVIIAVKELDFHMACNYCINILEHSEQKSVSDKELIADVLILSYSPPEKLKKLDPNLYSDVQTVIKALNHISDEQFLEATATIRTINITSPASHWRLFIKGIVAYYSGEDDKAEKCFNKTTPGSLLHNAARTFYSCINLKEYIKADYKNESLLKRICLLTDNGNLTTSLPRAEYLWRSGRNNDSFKHMRKSIPDFPYNDTPLQSELAFFFYIDSFNVLPDNKKSKYIDTIYRLFEQEDYKNKFEIFLATKLEAIMHHPQNDFGHYGKSITDMTRIWEKYILAYKAIYPLDTSIDSIFYSFWGSEFSKQPDYQEIIYDSFFGNIKKQDTVKDASIAEQYLKKAIECDRNYIDPYLKLLELYILLKKQSEKNKLLDTMVVNFPHNKDVMLQAGKECYNRKVYTKALGYFENGLQLDHLDPGIKEHLAICYIQIAKKISSKSKFSKILALYNKAISTSSADSTDFNRGLPYIQIRWAIFSQKFSEREKTLYFLKLAENSGLSHFKLHYFLYCISENYGVHKSSFPEIETEINTIFKQKSTSKYAVEIVQVYKYTNKLSDKYSHFNEISRVEKYISKLIAKNSTVEDIRYLITFFIERVDTGSYYGKTLATKLCEKMMKTFKKDPYLMYYLWCLEYPSTYTTISQQSMNKLKKIKTLAMKIGDNKLLNKINQSINNISHTINNNRPFPSNIPKPPGFENFFDDDDDFY